MSASFAYLVLVQLSLCLSIIEPGIFVHFKRIWSPFFSDTVSQNTKVENRHRAIDLSLSKESTLFFGDSITVGLAVSEISKHPVNFGAEYETTQTLANRINDYQSVLLKGDSVLMIGTNDIDKWDLSTTIDNYRTILSIITANRTLQVYAVLPVDENASKNLNGFNEKIEEMNSQLDLLVSDYKNTSFRTINSLLTDADGNLKRNYHNGDGVHLNHHGYKHWIKDLKVSLSKN